MKRLILLATLIVSSFAFTACETHVVGRRHGYSDRPYYNRSQVVVSRGYDDGYYQPGYSRSYYGGGRSGYYSGSGYGRSYRSGDYNRSSSRTNYVVNAPRYKTKKVIVNKNRRGDGRRNDDDDNNRRIRVR